MNLHVKTLACLVFTASLATAQDIKQTKAQRRDRDLAAKFMKKEIIHGDSIKILRAPFTSINSSERFFIDALQKRLDALKAKVATNDLADIEQELVDTRKLAAEIGAADGDWPISAYYLELDFYDEIFKRETRTNSSLGTYTDSIKRDNNYNTNSNSNKARSTRGSYKEVQVGPRGGQYYINKNGKKTYVKRK